MSDLKPSMTLAEAAAHTPWTVGYLRKAVNTTDPHAIPPPLRAKRAGRGQIVILAGDLTRWLEDFPDA